VTTAKNLRGHEVLVQWIRDSDINMLRNISDHLRSSGARMIFVIASARDGKLSVLAGRSNDLKNSSFDMKVLFGRLSALLQVTGGGRPDFVQGGGADQGQFLAERNQIEGLIERYLIEQGF
jgi:alanyl-tRNA synthetase